MIYLDKSIQKISQPIKRQNRKFNMPNQIAVSVTTKKDMLEISFVSMSKQGMTAEEKLLTSSMLKAMQKHPAFPKISKLYTGDDINKKKKR